MIRKIEDFIKSWDYESKSTLKMFQALTDDSLGRIVADGHRTLGNVAWHIATTLPEMMSQTGLEVAGPLHTAPTPATAAEIAQAYQTASESLAQQVKEKWTDASLEIEDDLYGEKWPRGASLSMLIAHEIHHRGQLSVLMRQAGLLVPGIYGPAKEEWAALGMPTPAE